MMDGERARQLADLAAGLLGDLRQRPELRAVETPARRSTVW